MVEFGVILFGKFFKAIEVDLKFSWLSAYIDWWFVDLKLTVVLGIPASILADFL